MKETKEQISWQNKVSRPQLDKALLQERKNKTLNPHKLEWVTHMQEAAKQTFFQKTSNRSWLAPARKAKATGSPDSKQKRNLAKCSARKDKIKWIRDQLTSDPRAEQALQLRTVRRQKQGFRGCKGQLTVNGQPIPWSSAHKAFRDHLQGKQWAPNKVADDIIEELKQKGKLRPPCQDTQPFTLKELSLLNNIYKIFASMLQARLAQEHDSHLRDTLFGFRAKKGTKHPFLS